MTTQALSAFLDELEQSAHAASVAEENYRREAAARIRELENERAFGFRRLTLMRTVADAIRDWGYEGQPIAVAYNDEFVPRGRYAAIQLQDGDRLEIVSPMQGG